MTVDYGLLPNLVVDSITTIPATPTVGTPTIIKVTIRNNGAARTPDNTYVGVAVLVDGTHLGGFLIPNNASNNLGRLDARATFTGQCNVNWTAVTGTHTIKAVADDVNRFAESNESDNTMSKSITTISATPLPDLVVQRITLSPGNPTIGTPTTINVKIRNNGTAPTPNNTWIGVAVFVDGGYQGAFFIPNLGSLGVGQSFTGTVNWTAVGGRHTIKAVVDDVNRIPESNEGNNSDRIRVRIR